MPAKQTKDWAELARDSRTLCCSSGCEQYHGLTRIAADGPRSAWSEARFRPKANDILTSKSAAVYIPAESPAASAAAGLPDAWACCRTGSQACRLKLSGMDTLPKPISLQAVSRDPGSCADQETTDVGFFAVGPQPHLVSFNTRNQRVLTSASVALPQLLASCELSSPLYHPPTGESTEIFSSSGLALAIILLLSFLSPPKRSTAHDSAFSLTCSVRSLLSRNFSIFT